MEREEAERLLICLARYEQRIEALDRQMAEEAEGDEELERLQRVPGAGPKETCAYAAGGTV
jgi:transposase